MKLKKVESKYKNKYVIEVEFMHGDADLYTTEDCVCEDELECKTIMEKLNGEIPTSPASGGDDDEYDTWSLDVFGSYDFIPYDKSGYDCRASYEDASAYFYNQDGVKFEVTF